MLPANRPTGSRNVKKFSPRKALRFGGVDIVLRTLALFRADERVGYHGVVSLFTEPLQGRARSMLGKRKWFYGVCFIILLGISVRMRQPGLSLRMFFWGETSGFFHMANPDSPFFGRASWVMIF